MCNRIYSHNMVRSHVYTVYSMAAVGLGKGLVQEDFEIGLDSTNDCCCCSFCEANILEDLGRYLRRKQKIDAAEPPKPARIPAVTALHSLSPKLGQEQAPTLTLVQHRPSVARDDLQTKLYDTQGALVWILDLSQQSGGVGCVYRTRATSERMETNKARSPRRAALVPRLPSRASERWASLRVVLGREEQGSPSGGRSRRLWVALADR